MHLYPNSNRYNHTKKMGTVWRASPFITPVNEKITELGYLICSENIQAHLSDQRAVASYLEK